MDRRGTVDHSQEDAIENKNVRWFLEHSGLDYRKSMVYEEQESNGVHRLVRKEGVRGGYTDGTVGREEEKEGQEVEK